MTTKKSTDHQPSGFVWRQRWLCSPTTVWPLWKQPSMLTIIMSSQLSSVSTCQIDMSAESSRPKWIASFSRKSSMPT